MEPAHHIDESQLALVAHHDVDERFLQGLGRKQRRVPAAEDDRQVRAGVKFSDAELTGIPFRVTVGKRGLAAGTAELTDRAAGSTVAIPLDEVAKHVREAVAGA